MKYRLLCFILFFLFLPAAARALDDVRIVEVGLKGYYSSAMPTPVRVEMSATQTGPVRLDFAVISGDPGTNEPSRTDHFSKQVSVKAGEIVDLELPILLPGSNHTSLELNASDGSGRKIGSSSVKLDPLGNINMQTPVVILCQDHRLCDEAQSQISSGNSEEDTEKNKSLRFVTLAQPREHWWEYSVARFLVVADSINGWTPEQKSAVEYYLRSGGAVLLMEKEAADGNFLAPYRRKELTTDPVHVGQGKLYRIADFQDLSLLFSGKAYQKLVAGSPFSATPYYDGNNSGDWLRRRAGVSFDFPHLTWVLTWLGAYILVVGLINFTLLRRWRRLEWGWITTTCIAAAFACGLYVASSIRRPKHVTLDDLVVYRMDSESPVAYEQIGLRVSSPDRLETTIFVGDDGVLDARNSVPSRTSNAEIATELTSARRIQPGWRMSLGPPAGIDLALLRWSFVDLDLRSFHVFSGAVSVSPDLDLKNNTGQQFREAMYLDFERNQQFFVRGLMSGQEVDLRHLAPSAIWQDSNSPGNVTGMRRPAVEETARDQGPFSLKTVSFTGLQLGPGKHFFVGVSDGPIPDTSLLKVAFVKQNVALTVVSLDQP